MQFNRHLKFEAWVKAWVKDEVKDALRKAHISFESLEQISSLHDLYLLERLFQLDFFIYP